jgi:hypothetical protein
VTKHFLHIAFYGIVILVAALVFIILFYIEEDRRGEHDWAICQSGLVAKGEILDLCQLAPPGKPEDDLSKAPIFAPLYEKEPDAGAPIKQIDIGFRCEYSARPKYHYLQGEPFDIAAWQKLYRSFHRPIYHRSPAHLHRMFCKRSTSSIRK